MEPERLGKYDVLRKIASGGMSEVWLCRLTGEEGFEKKVAVKVIHPRLSDDPRFRDLFAREARIAASLSHQNLVQVFDFGRHRGACFLAMEYVDGWTLGHAAAQARLRAAPVPIPVWRHWLEGILAGIGYLHSRGIVHRDVSPSNILLSRGGAVKIADFGIARGARHETGVEEGREGKFAYMSPEQARGEDASYSSDLFASAVAAAELFLPGRLVDGGSPEEILERLRRFDPGRIAAGAFPPEVDGLLRRALAGRREDRYPDADAFSEALRAAAPVSASRGQMSAYWDLLFPAVGVGDEPTVVVGAPPTAGPGVVRETRGRYGGKQSRRVKIGAASLLFVLFLGAGIGWKEMMTSDRGSLPAPPGVAGTASPPSTTGGGGRDDVRPRDIASSGRITRPAEDDAAAAGGERDARPGRSAPPDMTGPKAQPGGARTPVAGSAEGERGVWLETDPPGVAVSVDDEIPLGRTPLRLDVLPWKGRTITFRRDGFVRKAIRAESLAGLPVFRMEMERQTGTVEAVQAIPWARVYDGDRYLGDTPFGPVTLTTGEHRLRFVNEPLGIEREERVVIVTGANPKIIVYLTRK